MLWEAQSVSSSILSIGLSPITAGLFYNRRDSGTTAIPGIAPGLVSDFSAMHHNTKKAPGETWQASAPGTSQSVSITSLADGFTTRSNPITFKADSWPSGAGEAQQSAGTMTS